jgi:FKBP-type peptidyl-prolyl cis-trans isomerase
MTKHSVFSSGLSRIGAGLALSAIALFVAGCGKTEKPAGKSPALTTPEQKVSYAIGHNMGTNLTRQPGLTVDKEALRAGLEDGLAGAKLKLDEKDIQAAFAIVQGKAEAAMAEQGKANLAKANEFLEQNKKKFGVKTTASGLQYEILKSGKGGAKPKGPTSRVQVHYHGTLPDGTVFDSSVQRGQPVEFALNEVIAGWTEGLQLMSVGDKWRFVVPPALGYGPRPKGNIPPNSVLIFEVELLGVK